MLAPHELKNKSFKKALHGYNPAEVDEYIDFLIDNYTEVYRENNELDKKLKLVAASLEEMKDEETAIRETLIKSQKLGERIIREANEKADIITESIKGRCDEIIADFKRQIIEEKQEMWKIRVGVLNFKKAVYDLYKGHIQELQAISVNSLEEIVLPDENAIVGSIFGDVKSAVQKEMENAAERQNESDISEPPTTETRELTADEFAELIAKKEESGKKSKKDNKSEEQIGFDENTDQKASEEN